MGTHLPSQASLAPTGHSPHDLASLSLIRCQASSIFYFRMALQSAQACNGSIIPILAVKTMAGDLCFFFKSTASGWHHCGREMVGMFLASLVVQMVKNLPSMWETQVQPLGKEDLLEKRMATHSSILALRIPWTEKPDGLQSMGLQRVECNWVINTFTLTSDISAAVWNNWKWFSCSSVIWIYPD